MKLQSARNSLILLALVALLSGCRTVFQDFTQERIPQNPSGIYTFSFAANLPDSNRIPGSERAEIVINGKTFPMQKRDINGLVFSFDYEMPPGVTEARYYYIVYFDYNTPGGRKTATRYSTHESGTVFRAELVSTYSIQLVNDRGPVGAQVAVVGSGFTSQDVVLVDGVEATTRVHSPNSLEFTVPAISPGGPYPVVLRTGSGDIVAGNLRVDFARIQVHPASLRIASGESDFFIIQLAGPAPASGLRVDVLTDVPDSVIMPEVFIPGGAMSVNVTVTGGTAGSGIIRITVPGHAPVQVPVSVF